MLARVRVLEYCVREKNILENIIIMNNLVISYRKATHYSCRDSKSPSNSCWSSCHLHPSCNTTQHNEMNKIEIDFILTCLPCSWRYVTTWSINVVGRRTLSAKERIILNGLNIEQHGSSVTARVSPTARLRTSPVRPEVCVSDRRLEINKTCQYDFKINRKASAYPNSSSNKPKCWPIGVYCLNIFRIACIESTIWIIHRKERTG